MILYSATGCRVAARSRVAEGRALGERKLLGVGISGTVVAGVCCFTPVLVATLGALGLSGALAWLDVVLLPTLGVFIGITAYAALRLARGEARDDR